ncbi:MAG: hypothetical protein ACOX0K_06500 [Oscillospiraceae bacterium]|jgi:hypothetical protein
MDKNYKVDDILLEIKSKKLRQKERNTVVRPEQPSAEEFPTLRKEKDPPFREEEPLQQTGQPVSKGHPEIQEGDETAQLDLPPFKEERGVPLRFDGHVQPLTDRARIRQGRHGRFAPPPQEPAEDSAVIDFSAFRAGVMEAAGLNEEQESLEKTQVLSKLSRPNLDELRNRGPTILGVVDEDDEDLLELEMDLYDEDEEDYEDQELHRPAMDFSEYNSIEDRRDVAIDIARVKLWLVIRLLVTALLAGTLLYLVLSAKYLKMPLPVFLAPELHLKPYLLTLTVLTILTALAGSSAMGGGLISLFKMRANSDTLAALAMLGAVGQCVYATARAGTEAVRPEELTLYCAVAAMSMFFNALGKMTMISRIQANFKIISSDRPKKAVLLAEDESFCRHFVRGTPRRPAVAVSAKADFFTDFLALSYSDKYDVGINRVVAPICLTGAVVVGILTFIFTKGQMAAAITAFTAILCVCATFSATFIENIPLGKLTGKLAPRGGMVSGNKAVEDFCDVSALVLSENDLFPKGHIQIHGIKALENGRVDEAILDVASVVCAAGSAMSHVFLEMVGGNKKLLKKVENISYENARGLSAWVDSRRTLIGNARMMQAHGISLPAENLNPKYLQEGGEVFYLAVGGELTARFTVSYHIDEELALELDQMASSEKILIVYTVDPNLSPEKIWSLYGYPQHLIKIIPSELHQQYSALTAPRPEAMAEIAYTGRAATMVGALKACMAARSSILAATMVQLIQIALGYGLIALVAFLGTVNTVTVPVLVAYQLFWFVIIWLVQKIRSA